jgi:hypothetical protein
MDSDPLQEALKAVAVALKKADVPFALAAGYAAWARGGPEPDHDVDFVVAADAVDAARRALEAAGLRVEQPSEDWLFKVFRDDAMVDVLHAQAGTPVGEELLGRAEVMDVLSVQMPVLSPTDVVVGKLLAMDEHYCDFGTALPAVRALREQLDRDLLDQAAAESAFARAFLVLVEELGILEKR